MVIDLGAFLAYS